jgi:hypothetical protein
MKRTPLKRKTPLKAKSTLKSVPIVKKPKRKARKKGPPRDKKFLAFVRLQPCLVDGCPHKSEAHHFARKGMGQKCSDYKSVPLCHLHHVETWHRHGSLPGATRKEWMERFECCAVELKRRFDATRSGPNGFDVEGENQSHAGGAHAA